MAGKIINPGEYWPGVEPVKQETWQLDAEGARLYSMDDLSDCWNLRDLEMDRRALAEHLNELTQERDAYREALGSMAGLTREVIARETGLTRRQLTPSDVLLFCTAGAKSVLANYPAAKAEGE